MTKHTSLSGVKAPRGASVPSHARGAPVPHLSTKEIAALSRAREARWRPGLLAQPLHSEIFARAGDASGAGLALALARDALAVEAARQDSDLLAEPDDRRQVLWVQDKRAVQMTGRPYAHGLPEDLRERLIHVEAAKPEDALFALEEGLKCSDLACVIGEIVGNPRALDFTASRRLSLTAEKHGVALWLVRIGAEADLSSARMRWRASPSPSQPPRWNPQAPGEPAWKAELFRARGHAPGQWILSHDDTNLRAQRPDHAANASGAPYPRDLVRPTVGRSLAAVARA
jgi:protein ImuA